ncbi:FIST signal transduction protein [Ktedonosporobacter rubrisoli]|nr:FIST N-terminal domain-containing protein [Ktedonosporobacter rubrisoli]
MHTFTPTARAALAAHTDWEKALQDALAQIGDSLADVALLFASDEYSDSFAEIVRRVRSATKARILLGCSGQGIVGTGVELEDVPCLSLLTLSLPGASLRAAHITQDLLETSLRPDILRDQLDIPLDDVNAWLVFADPFQMNCEELINSLARAYADTPMLGGLASSDTGELHTHVFLNDEVFTEGAVALAIGGSYTILPLVSQGCEPIGEPWTITGVQENGLVETISNRSAYELLVETLLALPADMQRRAQRNLLVGLAADEYRATFSRGNFLIRNLIGVDRRTGALAIGAQPRVGQTIQFQIRDAETADLDLHELLEGAKEKLGTNRAVAGILCTCNGRGEGLFSIPNHDAELIEQELGPLPLAGLFCNGEIGPIGNRPFLHGFTASLALLVQRS